MLRRIEVQSDVNNVIVCRVLDPGGSVRSTRMGQIKSFLFPTPHPFSGEQRRDQGREEPGQVGGREGDAEQDAAVVRTQVRKVGLE